VEDDGHQTERGSGAVDCSQCHDQENRHGMKSGTQQAPQCYGCHTKHSILEKDNASSSVHPGNLKETCKSCHALECGEADYLSWLPSVQIATHGKQDFSQRYEDTNCMGCHQGMAAHGEEGPINDQNCYVCHLPGMGKAGLWGYAHPRADPKKQPEIHSAAWIQQIALLILIWGGVRFFVRSFSREKNRRR
jgi:hypothetical protein